MAVSDVNNLKHNQITAKKKYIKYSLRYFKPSQANPRAKPEIAVTEDAEQEDRKY